MNQIQTTTLLTITNFTITLTNANSVYQIVTIVSKEFQIKWYDKTCRKIITHPILSTFFIVFVTLQADVYTSRLV